MDPVTLANRVKAGETRAVSRLITLLENQEPVGQAALERLNGSQRHAAVIGITGYPGAGKSTLIDQLATAYRRQGKKVGIVAVDATSPRTGGALLGDRIRMQDHSLDDGIFIRSMATRGERGGLARATRGAVRVLEAASYDVIMVETVGVGQLETDVVDVASTVVAVVAPGLGDEVQAMKAGLLEIAHIVVVNKGDRDSSDVTVKDLQEWHPRVIRTVAIKGEGIPELIEAIAEHQRVTDLTRPPQARQDAPLPG
ncbi:MAG TPA: methylmalonyl Co-A mutase-associated GTPase MeaB, partial [Nitrospirales bacterium]|nr:methylmalonyl Co-A mutase-associated GTPase MeaB [Nitrospirales bacterium]